MGARAGERTGAAGPALPATEVAPGAVVAPGVAPAVAATGTARRRRPRDPLFLTAAVLASILVLFLALPVVALLGRAIFGEALLEILGQGVLIDALVLSLVTTAISLLLAIVFGTPLAFILARHRFRGSSLVETLVDLPIVLPPSVAGLALLLLLGRRGVLGDALNFFGITIPFTVLAVILAQAFVATPFYVRSVRSGVIRIDRDLEDAARVDGASETDVIRRISIPLAAPAIAAGLVLTWARALGEFGATIMFAGNIEGRTQTLPLFVYAEFQNSLDASVAAATILVIAAASVLIGVRLINWKNVFDLRTLS
jgi:molybdate transport system permease protein